MRGLSLETKVGLREIRDMGVVEYQWVRVYAGYGHVT